MARLYKIELYLTDIDDNYENSNWLEIDLERALDRLSTTKIVSIQSSKSFEWKDSLRINSVKATIDDYEKYFK